MTPEVHKTRSTSAAHFMGACAPNSSVVWHPTLEIKQWRIRSLFNGPNWDARSSQIGEIPLELESG